MSINRSTRNLGGRGYIEPTGLIPMLLLNNLRFNAGHDVTSMMLSEKESKPQLMTERKKQMLV